jgi:hypothetical protein
MCRRCGTRGKIQGGTAPVDWSDLIEEKESVLVLLH